MVLNSGELSAIASWNRMLATRPRELQDFSRSELRVFAHNCASKAEPRNANGAVKAPVLTPVTNSNTGRVPASVQRQSRPVPNAPFSPPPIPPGSASPAAAGLAPGRAYVADAASRRRPRHTTGRTCRRGRNVHGAGQHGRLCGLPGRHGRAATERCASLLAARPCQLPRHAKNVPAGMPSQKLIHRHTSPPRRLILSYRSATA